MTWLQNRAGNRPELVIMDLHSFIENNYSTWPKLMFWVNFYNKLVAVGKTNIKFREQCFFRSDGDTDCTLFHEVCKLHPPLKVVKKLIEIIPEKDKTNSYSSIYAYNHMSRTYRGDCKYPLHFIMKHGGSVDVVKLLVDADKEGDTITSSFGRDEEDSVYHLLIDNKEEHKREIFSGILQVLSLAHCGRSWSSLLNEGGQTKAPVALLWKKLKESGLSEEQILDDIDFKLLLKSTCYHFQYHHSSPSRHIPQDINERAREIELVPMAVAFLVCSPFFEKEAVTRVLERFCSVDNSFLLTPHKWQSNVECPLRHIVRGRGSYCIDSLTCLGQRNYTQFIVELILRLVPQCAEMKDSKGLLPLHIVADSQRNNFITANKRLSLVHTIWEAYPEAANTMDNEYNLPAFALPVRGKGEKDPYSYNGDDKYDDPEYTGMSSTFFLLRQQPEMLSVAIAQYTIADSDEEAKPPSKRPRISM